MAKIKQVGYYNHEKGVGVNSHLEYRPADQDRWSNRAAVFYIRIPDGYTELHETEEAKPFVQSWQNRGRTYIAATGKDEAEALKNYKAYLEMFFKSQTKEEKVILFRHDGHKPDSGWRGDRGVKLEFDYKICQKKTIGTASKYFEILDKHNVSEVHKNARWGGEKWHEIPYSKESEAFLKSIANGMIELIDKFDKFIGEPTKLLETIASKQKLLS